MQPVLNWIAQNVMPAIAPVFEFLGSEVLGVFGIISDVVGDVFDILGDVIDFITDIFKGDWSGAWEDVKRIFKDVWGTFEDIVRAPINAILSMVNGLLRGIQGMVNGIADALNTISIDLPGWLEDLTGYSSIGFDIPHWRAPQIPYLAQGGYVQKNTPQLAMIGDNRHQGEIVAPEDKLRQIAADAVRAAGSGGISKAELESIINNAVLRIIAALGQMGFYMDGELLARAIQKAQESLDGRYNPVKLI